MTTSLLFPLWSPLQGPAAAAAAGGGTCGRGDA